MGDAAAGPGPVPGGAPRWPPWPSSRAATPPGRSCTGCEGSRRGAFVYRDKRDDGHHRPAGRSGVPAPRSGTRGTAPWLAWLGLHLVYLVGFRNRAVVLVNWAWRYFRWPSGPRLIFGSAEPGPAGPGKALSGFD